LIAQFGAFLTIALCVAQARAAPGDATRLDYARGDHAASCPDREALQAAVVKRLGYDPFFPVARQTIVVAILDGEAGLRAEMRLVDADGIIRGSRELRESRGHCDELVAALALAISIALDPSAALGEEPTGAGPAATAQATKATESQSDPPGGGENQASESAPATPVAPAGSAKKHREPPTQTEPSRYPRGTPVGLRASGFSSLGVAPALAAGVRVGVSVRHDWFALAVEFADQLAASRTAAGGGSVIGSLAEGTLATCFAPNALAACALLSIGSLRSEGRDVPQPVNQRSLYGAIGARVELSPRLFDQLHLLMNADALKSLTPITLRLRGEDVWHTPFISLAASLGLELRFQ
jgi:hypothetical protein